jgi:predicted phosphoribosyltransferase
MYERFKDRHHAGVLLAERLRGYEGRKDVLVLALPRGGVPVAYEVAKALKLPLDVFTVRKLGAPGHEEFAVGAVASGKGRFIDDDLVRALRISPEKLTEIIDREEKELARRESLYRGVRRPLNVDGKTVILVDDGMATGSTMRAAVTAVRKLGARATVVAVPVCSPSTCEELERELEVWCVCVRSPDPFIAVGLWYADFTQTSDEQVQHLLTRADAGDVSARHYV